MRSFLVVIITIVPILLTGTALGYVSVKSRRYAQAEREFINALQQLSWEQEDYRNGLIQAEENVDAFLANTARDAHPLIDAIELLAGTAKDELRKDSASIIVGILRHGSDRNRANYLKKLLSEIDLTPPSSSHRERTPPDPSAPGDPQATAPSYSPRLRSTEHERFRERG
jgi:hypothetical protein